MRSLRRFERLAYRLFSGRAAKAVERNPRIRLSLQKAHIYLRPEAYLAGVYLTALIVAALALVPIILLGLLQAAGIVQVSRQIFVVMLPVPALAPLGVYLLALILPDIKAANRARDINAKLPYALNYVTTMASAGATPEALFAGLAEQPIYGAVAHEAAWINRDLKVLGADVVTALNRAIDRSPSAKFQDLLQGAVTSLTSGGDLKVYFLNKSEQYLYENRQDQRKFLDSLGVLAESFVTVVVAGPLFLIVILSVMSSFSGSGEQTLLLGYLLILVLIPMSQVGFGYTIKLMTPEA